MASNLFVSNLHTISEARLEHLEARRLRWDLSERRRGQCQQRNGCGASGWKHIATNVPTG